MEKAIISDWQAENAELFGKRDLMLHHRLNETGLFTREALAELINKYPNEMYNLSTMGYDPMNPVWREGTIGDLNGKQVIEAIERGRMWLNLRSLELFDDRYASVLTKIFEDFEDWVPGFSSFRRKFGVLISSPLVQVFYHADVPGQALWQLEGEKRVYVYPNEAPYLKPVDLEGIITGMTEEEIPYEQKFDEAARIYDLKPGEMVHWPLNCPHRVENKDCLNISVTTEHWTSDIRKSYAVNYANGVLRNKFGFQNLSQNRDDYSVYPKAALTMMWRKLDLNSKDKVVRMIDFRVDPESDIGMMDVPAFAKGA